MTSKQGDNKEIMETTEIKTMATIRALKTTIKTERRGGEPTFPNIVGLVALGHTIHVIAETKNLGTKMRQPLTTRWVGVLFTARNVTRNDGEERMMSILSR